MTVVLSCVSLCCRGLARGLLEIAQKVAAQGLKTSSFWVGPLPMITVYDLDDIQVSANIKKL